MRRVNQSLLIVTTPVILACVVFAQQLMTGSHPPAKPAKASTRPGDLERVSARPDRGDVEDGQVTGDDLPDPVDLYGNEVTDAVAKYRFDAGGSLYELHSPQTEVPKLAPPKT